MAQKKNKSVSSNGHSNLANPKIQGQQKKKKKKKSIVDTKRSNLLNQINISNRENATQKFNQISNEKKKKKKKSVPPYQICKGKSIMEPSTDQMDVDQVIGIHFQEEIMMEILNRLPVRSLLRFKCVSTFWKALITDPYFKMKHHIHAKNDQNSQKFLTGQLYFGEDNDMFCINSRDYRFDFYCSSLSMVQVVEDEQKLDCPLSCKPKTSRIYGSCDGLVLLVVISESLDKHLLLWNPSTRESIELPHPESPLIYCICGLGYDATSDDYKILAINLNDLDGRNYFYDSHNVSIEVLAKSCSWRRIGYPTGILRLKVLGIVVRIIWHLYMEHFIGFVHEGAYHGDHHDIILSFHLIFQMRCMERYHCWSKCSIDTMASTISKTMVFLYWVECFAFIVQLIICWAAWAILSCG